MVRLKLLVRIIPEDVYIRDIESPTSSATAAFLLTEKRLLHIVHHPESVSIGTLANEIKQTFQNIHHDPLGDIKYVKDGALDADLDPEMSVYDAFVDAGKASTCLDDQAATIKIIREIRGKPFDVREGSVVPDLNKPRFQPRALPPVPHFPNTCKSLGKRPRDDTFRDGGSDGEGSHSPSSGSRRRRFGPLKESGGVERPVPSIERDLRKPTRDPNDQHQGSPVVIPETQDSPLRQGTNTQVGGGEVLGTADEPKSESPEVGNSVHTLPLVRKEVNDVEMLEPVPRSQSPVLAETANLDDAQVRSGAASAEEVPSRSSSNYYSLTSGSLHPIFKSDYSSHESNPSSAKSAARSNKSNTSVGLTRTKLDSAREQAVQKVPITPPSDASLQGRSRATVQDTSCIDPNALDPQARTSCYSNKFLRQDRVQSAESQIDDSQMSPRSRKSVKRPRATRHLEAVPKVVGVKELSGLHLLDDKRPLIQERKRQRKETKWDFSEYLEGLSETDEENVALDKAKNLNNVQQSRADDVSSESNEAEDVARQRSKSEALSDATNKDSNASTERPAMSAGLDSIAVSRAARNQIPNQGVVSDGMIAEDSDKENTNHEQMVYPHPRRSDRRGGAGMVNQDPSGAHEKEHANEVNQFRIEENNNNSVIDILNDVVSVPTSVNTETKARKVSQLPREIAQESGNSARLPDSGSLKKPHSRKKKSRVEEEKTLKPSVQKPETCSAVKPVITDASKEADHNNLNSTAGQRSRRSATSLPEPDEQLSQDLQASVQASNHRAAPSRRTGRASFQGQVTSSTYAAGIAGHEPTRSSPNKLRKETANANQTTSPKDQGLDRSVGFPKNLQPPDFDDKMESQNPDEDGKLGLGFSQSPPHRDRSSAKAHVSANNFGHEKRIGSSEFLPNKKVVNSFLKKQESFEKGMSSQSWNADTPSRSAQPGKKFNFTTQHIGGGVSSRMKSVLGSGNDPDIRSPVQLVRSESESETESEPEERSSADASEDASKAGEPPVKNGEEGCLTDIAMASVEMSSDTSGSEPDVGSSSSQASSEARKLKEDGPTVVPTGNNVYPINGTPIVVPPGFTLDGYLATRKNLENQPSKPTSRIRTRSSGKSATPTLNQKGSSATPVPAPAKVAMKKDASKGGDKRPRCGPTAKDPSRTSIGIPAAKPNLRQEPSTAKTNGLPRPPPVRVMTEEHTPTAPVVPKAQASTRMSIPVKQDSVAPTAASDRFVRSAAKAHASNVRVPEKTPGNMNELRAQRKLERAKMTAASSAKRAGATTFNGINSNKFLAGVDSDSSESETETETETTSSDGDAANSKAKTTSTGIQAAAGPTIDLSIRDPSPSSGEEE